MRRVFCWERVAGFLVSLPSKQQEITMSETEKSPLTRADVDAQEKSKPAGAHGGPAQSGEAATGASRVRKGPDEIQPSEDVDQD
jgi:hypothetical protein